MDTISSYSQVANLLRLFKIPQVGFAQHFASYISQIDKNATYIKYTRPMQLQVIVVKRGIKDMKYLYNRKRPKIYFLKSTDATDT